MRGCIRRENKPKMGWGMGNSSGTVPAGGGTAFQRYARTTRSHTSGQRNNGSVEGTDVLMPLHRVPQRAAEDKPKNGHRQ